MSSQNGTEQTLPSVHLSSDRRDLGTATAKHEKLDRSDDEQDGRDDDSGWQLDDLQDETYELMPRSDNAYANGSTAPLSDLEGSGKSDISSALAMVKAVVSEDDDPSLPTLTFRVIVLGTVLCAIGAAVSQLFFVSGADKLSHIIFAQVFQISVQIERAIFLGLPDHPAFLSCRTLDGTSAAKETIHDS